MEPFIPLIWFLFVLIIPTAFLVTGFISYINGVKTSEIIVKLFAAFLAYICMTAATFPFMFFVVYAGAHTKPVGNSLDLKGEIIYFAIILAYTIIGWLLCSFINGGLVKPWKIFHWSNEKTQSIFDVK